MRSLQILAALGAAAALAATSLGGQAAAAAPPAVRLVSVASVSGYAVKRIMYTSRGLTIEALVAPATAARAGDRPVLVLSALGFLYPRPFAHYGYGWSARLLQMWSAWYPQAVVIAPDFQGYLASGGTIGTVSDDEAELQAAVRIAVRDFGGNPSRIYVFARYLGADPALMLPSRVPGVRAVAAISPYASYTVSYGWAASEEASPHPSAVDLRAAAATTVGDQAVFGGTPEQKPAAYAAQSASVRLLAREHVPVLFVDGTGDSVTPWQGARRFANELAAAGGNVQMVLYKGGSIGLLNGDYGIVSLGRVLSWFGQHGLRNR